ncbi:hypothetical protein ABPG77_002999 [Micractinium sp. CCAP 211/92]
MELPSGAAAPGPGSESTRPQASFTGNSSRDKDGVEPAVVEQPPVERWQRCLGQEWTTKNVPTAITLTKTTLQRLFAWQYGSSKQHLPTVIFNLALTGGEVVQLPPVTLNAPSRDDTVRLQRVQQRQGSAKVDGYQVPANTVNQIYGLLGVQPGGHLKFVSEGWQDGCLVLRVCFMHPGMDKAAALQATAAESAPAAAGAGTPSAAQPSAPVGDGPAGAGPVAQLSSEQQVAVPAWGAATPQAGAAGHSEAIFMAAAARQEGPSPAGQLAGAAGSPLPASSTVTAARIRWLSAVEVYELLCRPEEHGLRIVDALSAKPGVGDLILCRKGSALWRADGHDWGPRRNCILKVEGRDAIKAHCFKTQDGALQVRAYTLLDEAAPNAHLELLHYRHAPLYARELEESRQGRKAPKSCSLDPKSGETSLSLHMQPPTVSSDVGPLIGRANGDAPASNHDDMQQVGPAAAVQQPPEALWRRCVGQPWAPRGVPTIISLTKRTLQKLFAWQHGSSKQHLPTVIFTLVLSSCEVVQLPAVTLNAPSRDDNDSLQRAQQGQGRAKVDGYPVPANTVNQIYGLLGVQPGGHLKFVSEGWQDGCLVLRVCFMHPGMDQATALQETAAASAPAAAGAGTPSAVQPSAPVGDGPAGAGPVAQLTSEQQVAVPALGAATPQAGAAGSSEGILKAAAARQEGPSPAGQLAGAAGSPQPASSTVTAARIRWLSAVEVYELLCRPEEHGLRIVDALSAKPGGGNCLGTAVVCGE